MKQEKCRNCGRPTDPAIDVNRICPECLRLETFMEHMGCNRLRSDMQNLGAGNFRRYGPAGD